MAISKKKAKTATKVTKKTSTKTKAKSIKNPQIAASKKAASKPKSTVKAKKIQKKPVVSKQKVATAKKTVAKKVSKIKKSKPKIVKEISINELFNHISKQNLIDQQNLKNLEHHSHNVNKGFNAQKNGFQMHRISRHYNLNRGKK